MKNQFWKSLLMLLSFITIFFLPAYGGDGSGRATSPPAAAPAYLVSGTIRGLTSAVVLENNGCDALTIPANATSFTFATPLLYGSAYDVTVKTLPPGQNQACTVISNGSGTISGANVSNVKLSCAANTEIIFCETVPASSTGSACEATAAAVI